MSKDCCIRSNPKFSGNNGPTQWDRSPQLVMLLPTRESVQIAMAMGERDKSLGVDGVASTSRFRSVAERPQNSAATALSNLLHGITEPKTASPRYHHRIAL